MRHGPQFSTGGPINASSPYATREAETLSDIQIKWESLELCETAAIERLIALNNPVVLRAFVLANRNK